MEKKETEIKQILIKTQDYFKSGTVVFLNSGHPLCLSNNHYRCQLDCNHKCEEKKEGQFKKEYFERNFSRFAKNFQIQKYEVEILRKKFMRKYFMDVLLGVEETNQGKEEIVEANISNMKENLEKGKSVKRIANETLDELVEINRDEYPLILFSYLIGLMATLSKPEEEKWLGQALALITKRVEISDGGTIEQIEFERWGWYVLNLINKNSINYLWKIKNEKGVKILNDTKDELIEKGILEAIDYFKESDFEDALHNHMPDTQYQYYAVVKNLMKGMYEGDTEALQKALTETVERMANDPIFQAMGEVLPIKAKRVWFKKFRLF